MDLVGAFRVFVCVAEAGGFSAAARKLGLGQPTISKQMAALEEYLGARLFNRGAHSFALSADGLALVELALNAIEAIDEAKDLTRLRRQSAIGALRITGPIVFGRNQLIPRLVLLTELHPGLELDVVLSDHFVDLVDERFDIALRVGEITDGSLIARSLKPVRRVAIASQAYIERRGAPSHPAELTEHQCVVYTRLATGARWRFVGPGGPIEVNVRGAIKINNSAGVLAAVHSGAGIGVVPMFTLTDQLQSGGVKVILEEFEPSPLPMNVVYTSRRYLSVKMRIAIDFLVEQFGA